VFASQRREDVVPISDEKNWSSIRAQLIGALIGGGVGLAVAIVLDVRSQRHVAT
jgi:hypothetical protein